jgi:flagellar motor switch protein FliM
MTDRQLTATEIDDLLSVFKGGKPRGGLTEVEHLNLDKPNRVPRGILETVEIRHEQATSRMRDLLRTALGCDIGVTLLRLDQERFQVFKDRQESPCCGFVVDMEPLRHPAYVIFDFEFAFACIDRLLGGGGKTKGVGKDLTPTEIAVMREVLDPLIQIQVEIWSRYIDLTPRLRGMVSNPRFMRDVRFDDAVLVAEYRLGQFAEGHGFRIAMPLPGLEAKLQYRRKEEPANNEESRRRRGDIESNLADVDVDVAVKIGETSILVRDVLALEEGDVIVVDQGVGDLLDLTVEGRAKYRGRLMSKGGRLVFRVQRSTDAGEQRQHD